MPLTLFIADDHAIFRSGLMAFLEKEKEFQIVGDVGDSTALLEALPKTHVDVVILDIHMPGPPVAQVIKDALKIRPDLGIVILTMHEEEYYLREVFQAGARAFVLKKSSGTELMNAIRAAYNKAVYVDPALSGILVSSYVEPSVIRKEKSHLLTKREEDVLKLLAFGYTNQEIAENLFISQRTVETHRAHLLEKLGLKTRAELVRYALERGLLIQSKGQ